MADTCKLAAGLLAHSAATHGMGCEGCDALHRARLEAHAERLLGALASKHPCPSCLAEAGAPCRDQAGRTCLARRAQAASAGTFPLAYQCHGYAVPAGERCPECRASAPLAGVQESEAPDDLPRLRWVYDRAKALHDAMLGTDHETRATAYNQRWAGLHNALTLRVPAEYYAAEARLHRHDCALRILRRADGSVEVLVQIAGGQFWVPWHGPPEMVANAAPPAVPAYPCCEGVRRVEDGDKLLGGWCPVHGATKAKKAKKA